ncbi:MAG TPA: prepilin-type N-terminal cleavage/methylation domain-containing protein [Candidatus Eisenbacteria bacterium]|jgi:prepilin-type N-terminal cleavage/methylation domain-containing protein|nr:prepilin-type N-terminal cleavage/methylation domain-containing protein [Candidatus Eisenbacteria bacterium]
MQGKNGKSRGFTLIELLIVISLIGLIASIALVGMRSNPQKRLDTKRVSDIQELQKALGLYVTTEKAYPVMTGCVNGTSDLVSTELHAKGSLGNGSIIKDPSFPSDITQCYYYVSNGSTYTVRYTLQTDSSAGAAGNHLVQP